MNLKRIEERGDTAIVVDADTGDLYSLHAIEGLKEAVKAIRDAKPAKGSVEEQQPAF